MFTIEMNYKMNYTKWNLFELWLLIQNSGLELHMLFGCDVAPDLSHG